MRRLIPDGVCQCCGRYGAVWTNVLKPLGLDTAGVHEADTTTPDLCDRCDYAQRCWDARQEQIRAPGAGYPYLDRPPLTPPVRREGDVELGADGWPLG